MQESRDIGHKVRESIKKINVSAAIRFDEAMEGHTTFRCGGRADIFASPATAQDLAVLLDWAKNEQVPCLVVGGGANLLVSDSGIRGLTIHTGSLDSWEHQGQTVTVGAGLSISEASARAADLGLAGLDFIYSMPGSTGGAVYMNARCFEGEIRDVLTRVDYLDGNFRLCSMNPADFAFAYKDTPFMHQPWTIVGASFDLKPADPDTLWERMKSLEADRRKKGHFAAPCAGSVFKNNHQFGQPSGKIIDSLGLRGTSMGGAKVSDQHANIIVNTGSAKASDIKALMDLVARKVLDAYGYVLEPELVLAGDWD